MSGRMQYQIALFTIIESITCINLDQEVSKRSAKPLVCASQKLNCGIIVQWWLFHLCSIRNVPHPAIH